MKRISFLLLSAFVSAMAMAQNSGSSVNVDITKSNGSSTAFPWLWVIGGIVFIVLLVALLGSGGTDRVIEKKTIIKE